MYLSSTSLTFVRGVVASPHRGPVTPEGFHLMTSPCDILHIFFKFASLEIDNHESTTSKYFYLQVCIFMVCDRFLYILVRLNQYDQSTQQLSLMFTIVATPMITAILVAIWRYRREKMNLLVRKKLRGCRHTDLPRTLFVKWLLDVFGLCKIIHSTL